MWTSLGARKGPLKHLRRYKAPWRRTAGYQENQTGPRKITYGLGEPLFLSLALSFFLSSLFLPGLGHVWPLTMCDLKLQLFQFLGQTGITNDSLRLAISLFCRFHYSRPLHCRTCWYDSDRHARREFSHAHARAQRTSTAKEVQQSLGQLSDQSNNERLVLILLVLV